MLRVTWIILLSYFCEDIVMTFVDYFMCFVSVGGALAAIVFLVCLQVTVEPMYKEDRKMSKLARKLGYRG